MNNGQLFLIKKMFRLFLFDYFFYRLYHLNGNKGQYQGVAPAAGISVIQLLYFLDINFVIVELFFKDLSLTSYAKVAGYFAATLGVVLLYLNFKKYNQRIERLNEQWKDESIGDRRVKGFVILLVIILPFAIVELLTNI